MFRSAVIKLTAWYVGALIIVCLIFSIPIFTITSERLRLGAENQVQIVRRIPNRLMTDEIYAVLQLQKEKQIEEDRSKLLRSIIFTNLIIISVGAAGSFLFARRTLKPIEDLHNSQTRFTSDASHELRTPLSVMQTEIDVALRNKNLSLNTAKEILRSNLEEIARLRNLSNQLLSLTRPFNQNNFKDINIKTFLHREKKNLEKRYGAKINLIAEKEIIFKFDAALLSQVLDILINNAVKYSGKNEIEISTKKVRDQVQIKIKDFGKGISKKDLPYIFDRFYRGSNATRLNLNGHGLGLALAKNIMTKLGGDIRVKSNKNGTTFTIIV